MASSMNRATILGRLGRDPETRYTADGKPITALSVATSESWKDRSSGEWKESTEWHKVSVFGPMAEAAGEHLSKGSRVYIEGKLKTRKWQDKDGNDRWTTEITADRMIFLDKPDDAKDASEVAAKDDRRRTRSTKGNSTETPQNPDFDDEIPF